MANKSLFKSIAGKLLPVPDALNEHKAPAYALDPKSQLAQYAATGCLNSTFYATAEEHQLVRARVSSILSSPFLYQWLIA